MQVTNESLRDTALAQQELRDCFTRYECGNTENYPPLEQCEHALRVLQDQGFEVLVGNEHEVDYLGAGSDLAQQTFLALAEHSPAGALDEKLVHGACLHADLDMLVGEEPMDDWKQRCPTAAKYLSDCESQPTIDKATDALFDVIQANAEYARRHTSDELSPA